MKVLLEYKRDGASMDSSGRVLFGNDDGVTSAINFAGMPFKEMITTLARVVAAYEPSIDVAVVMQRVDREGLLPYALDPATVHLLRTDPVAAIEALSFPMQNSGETAKRDGLTTSLVVPPLRAGHDTLADAFGEVLYFRVREHELECPGCGFWGMYISPGLLKDPDRAGAAIKCIFICPKKCHVRLPITCAGDWGYARVEDLLASPLTSFYFPRAWNDGHQWISKESLEQKAREYAAEKEKIGCSEPYDKE